MFDEWDDIPDDYEENYNDDYDEETGMNRRDTTRALIHALMPKATGISFILMMEDPHWSYSRYNSFSLYPRFSQQCYGELRKYEMTHPGECTQPDNGKPTDLYFPFPEGIPAALGLPFFQYVQNANIYDWKAGKSILHPGLSKDTDRFFEEFFTDDNPWVRGFDGTKNIEKYYHEVNGEKYFGGIVLKHCHVDPTVTVQMCWFIRSYIQGHWTQAYIDCRENGLSPVESYAFLMNNNGRTDGVGSADSYHYSSSFSARRFFEQKPNDLTGGTLVDRYDYNRTDIQDLWSSNFYEGDAISWGDHLKEELKSEENIFKAGQKALHKMAEKEPPIIEKPWEVHMTSGNKKPSLDVFYINPKDDSLFRRIFGSLKGKKAA